MDKQKLLQEHKDLVESLIEKTRYIYSEDFYALDEFEKQKFVKDKMATEGHLSSLSALLWVKVPQLNSVTDLFTLGILGSMFGGGFGSSSNYNAPITPLPSIDDKSESEAQD